MGDRHSHSLQHWRDRNGSPRNVVGHSAGSRSRTSEIFNTETESFEQMKIPLRLLTAVILLGIIVWQLGGLEEVGGLISGIDPRYVVLILLVNTADRALMTFKWARLLHARG